MKNRIRNIVLILFLVQGIKSQVLVNCANLSLSADTFYLSHVQYTTVVGDLHYLDTNWAVYPVLRLILEDTSIITSPNIMVLSMLAYPIDSLEQFNFPIHFKTTNYPSNTVVNALFHVYDSDMPGDSIVTCYFPIRLILQNPLSIKESITGSSGIKVYPNPANGNFTIDLESVESKNLRFLVYELNGKLVFTSAELQGEKPRIEIPELEAGMYIYKLLGDKGVEATGKLALEK